MTEPETAAEYLDRGCDKDDQKDSKGAIEDYTKAIELNPNYAEAYANRGCAKEELGDKEGAIADWQKASDLGDEEAAQWIQEMKEKEPQKPIDNNVFTQLFNYDLQKDYVDKLSKEEKLELFRGLTWEIEQIADKEWNSEENYTEEFMVNWITNSYSKEVLTPFENALDPESEDDDENEYEPWDDHLFIFTFNKEFKDFDDYEIESYEINEEDKQISFLCPSFWLDVPREFLISWALEFYDIEAKFVEDMTMSG